MPLRRRKHVKKQPKRHNAVAADLRTAKYRPRVVKSKRLYSRKAKHSGKG
jgi:stalled ribosome alternative rescue factor ArfA